MREIKFRAWHKIWEKMYELDCTHYIDAPEYIEPIAWDNDDFCFMQFTGKKDTDGKDIYEGDIIELKYMPKTGLADRRVGPVSWDNNMSMFSVDYINNGQSIVSFHDDRLISRKVIGNIWDNPELLKGETNEKQNY